MSTRTRPLERGRWQRLITRARERYERRQGCAVALWARYRAKHKPTLWFAAYQQAYALEEEALLLLTRLGQLQGQS